jgi:hypothetical protein
MAHKRPPPKTTKEFTRFKTFLRRLVAVPREEIQEQHKEYRRQRKPRKRSQ